MKKIIALVLSLLMLLSCLSTAIAAEMGYTLVLEGEGDPTDLTGATAYTLPVPECPAGKQFAGWYGELEGKAAFLPAGYQLTLTADATLTALFVGIAMRQAPEIRYDIEGLRFLTDIGKADLQALQGRAAVTFGTLIVPKDYLTKSQALTHGFLNDQQKTHLDVGSIGPYTETETTVSIAGSIGHVLGKNHCRSFLAAGYLSFAYTDGTQGCIYAPVTGATDVASLYDLALAAFSDRVAQQSETHQNSVEGGYSPYSVAQLAFCKRILDATVNITLTGSVKKPVVTVKPELSYYTAPFTASYDSATSKCTLRATGDYRFDVDFHSLIIAGGVAAMGRDQLDETVNISSTGKVMTIAFPEYSDFY